MAVGLERRGKIPFVSTFASFFSRAYDQIRMAAIGTSAIRLVGSHAGVSIGQDGPSQMGLEDLSMMQAIPNSLVLYPCDAVSTHKLIARMGEYTHGISYLRTTRMDTPVIYDVSEDFPIGGCKVIKQTDKDVACIIAAGITLHEALKAYEHLISEDIHVAVIDLYSIKPLDSATIIKIAEKAQGNIITVEDHYLEGGLGQAVSYAVRNQAFTVECLAVTELPRSGKPEELLALMKIDAPAIISAVKKCLRLKSK
jgi:transketolase